MLSGRELALDQNPSASGWVNQRIVYTHGIGVAMVPGQRGHQRGPAAPLIGNLPPQSVAGAPPITEPRIYFGERSSDYVVVGAQTGRVRLSDRRGRRLGRRGHRDALERHDRDEARQHPDAAALLAPVPGPRPAHQRPESPATASSSSIAPSRTGCTGSPRSCATTRTRTSSSTRPAAWSTSRTPTPRPTGSRTRRRSIRRPSRRPRSARRASTTSGTA